MGKMSEVEVGQKTAQHGLFWQKPGGRRQDERKRKKQSCYGLRDGEESAESAGRPTGSEMAAESRAAKRRRAVCSLRRGVLEMHPMIVIKS
jgi:hypothetical protein